MFNIFECFNDLHRRVAHACADVLFPLRCVGCGVEGTTACNTCATGILFQPIMKCPVCGKVTVYGNTCGTCADASNLNGIVAGFDYRQKMISALIKEWKYNGINAAGLALRKLAHEWSARNVWIAAWSANAILVPIPLHRRRFAERGFNQAMMLAECWSEILGAPVVDCLLRTTYTEAQAKLSGALRRQMDAGLFVTKQNFFLDVSKVILIDDVYTTGATLERAAHTVRAAGATEVYGLVYARET